MYILHIVMQNKKHTQYYIIKKKLNINCVEEIVKLSIVLDILSKYKFVHTESYTKHYYVPLIFP